MAYKIKNAKRYNAWNVSLHRKNIDRVHYDADIKKEDVKKSLVEHDGYDPEIKLNKDYRY
jgi:hypothetical protein